MYIYTLYTYTVGTSNWDNGWEPHSPLRSWLNVNEPSTVEEGDTLDDVEVGHSQQEDTIPTVQACQSSTLEFVSHLEQE